MIWFKVFKKPQAKSKQYALRPCAGTEFLLELYSPNRNCKHTGLQMWFFLQEKMAVLGEKCTFSHTVALSFERTSPGRTDICIFSLVRSHSAVLQHPNIHC